MVTTGCDGGCEQAGIASASVAREKDIELISHGHQKAGEELQPCRQAMKETESSRERTSDTVWTGELS